MRGSAAGEPIVSPASTPEYEKGYERVFGDRRPERGRWVMTANGLVPVEEYVPEPQARDAPIMVDRFYEGAKATDGTDIGSRRKHRQYMRDHNLTTFDDYKGEFARKVQEREAVKEGHLPDKTRREAIARALYKMDPP